MDELIAAGLVVAGPMLGQEYCVPDEGPLRTLPRTGTAFLGVDHNGNQTRVWYERGQVLRESAFPVFWWRQQ